MIKLKKVLFICTGNRDRSPTAEAIYQNRHDLEVKSAGVSLNATIRFTKELLAWADLILVMGRVHKDILDNFPEVFDSNGKTKVIVLGIRDIYKRDDPHLIQIIKEKADPYIKFQNGKD